jgi:hypothetical protein
MSRFSRNDPQADRFVAIFQRSARWDPVLADQVQLGGALPVFIGRRRYPQYGEGFLDVLRRVAKFVMPIALSGASKFLGETQRATEEGASIGDAAKAALRPAAQAAVGKTVGQVYKALKRKSTEPQKGGGRRRRKGKKARGLLPNPARVAAHVYKSAAPAGPTTKYNF